MDPVLNIPGMGGTTEADSARNSSRGQSSSISTVVAGLQLGELTGSQGQALARMGSQATVPVTVFCWPGFRCLAMLTGPGCDLQCSLGCLVQHSLVRERS